MSSGRRIEPGPGQESVWDYPRPPAVRRVQARVEIDFGGAPIAACEEAIQVLETSHPPTFYVPMSAFTDGVLHPVPGTTWCEFKGTASYFDVVVGDHRAERAAWHYPSPTSGFEELVGHVAVMPGAMDQCRVDGEVVAPQEGGFYGGWVTSAVCGPFKGAAGTRGW